MDPHQDDSPPPDHGGGGSAARDADIAIVLIGPEWLRSADEYGHRRLFDPDDAVRRQIAVARSAEMRFLPVLVRGAHMPDERELPDEIRTALRANALMVSADNWEYEVARVAELAARW